MDSPRLRLGVSVSAPISANPPAPRVISCRTYHAIHKRAMSYTHTFELHYRSGRVYKSRLERGVNVKRWYAPGQTTGTQLFFLFHRHL